VKDAHGTPSFYHVLRDELAQDDTADLEDNAQVIAQCDIENQIESEQDDEALYDFSPTLHPLVKRILPHVIKFGIGYRRTVLRFHKWASNGVGHFINKNLYAKPQIEN